MKAKQYIPWVLGLLSLTLSLGGLAQAGNAEYACIQTPKSLPVWIPFNKVIVLDNREDTAVLGYNREGHPIRFQEPMDLVLKRTIQYAVQERSTGNNTILIDVRQFRINETAIVFSCFLYHKKGEAQYIYLGNLKDLTQPVINPQMYYNEGLTRLVGNLISHISDSLASENLQGEVTPDKVQALNQQIKAASFAVLRAGPETTSGKYTSLLDFKAGNRFPCAFTMRPNQDSTYSIETRTPGMKHFLLSRTWGLVDVGGNQYLHIWGDKFLLMDRMRDTFYVHIPHSLPSMNYIIRIRESGKNDANSSASNNGNGGVDFQGLDFRVVLLLAGAVLVGYGVYVVVLDEHKSKLFREGMRCVDYRDFAIDLETESIIYRRPALPPDRRRE